MSKNGQAQCPTDPDDKGQFTMVEKDNFPYTTFYRADSINGSFNYNRSLEASMDTFRTRLSLFCDSTFKAENEFADVTYDTYSNLFTLATKKNSALRSV
jgi:hypothetical protein